MALNESLVHLNIKLYSVVEAMIIPSLKEPLKNKFFLQPLMDHAFLLIANSQNENGVRIF